MQQCVHGVAILLPKSTIKCYGERRHIRKKDRKRNVATEEHRSGNDKVVVTIDLKDVAAGARGAVSNALRNVSKMSDELKSEALKMWKDVRTGVAVNNDARLIITLQRSTLDFVAVTALCMLAVALLGNILVGAARKHGWGWEEGYKRKALIKRDRSLGGREVIVALPAIRSKTVRPHLLNPLQLNKRRSTEQNLGPKFVKRREQLPEWWSTTASPVTPVASYASILRSEADCLVRVIMKKRFSGVDFVEDDIVELRRICKDSGIKVNFDTENTRDSFYRAAVNYVLSACPSSSRKSVDDECVEYKGESAVSFLCGLATNIDMDGIRAASIVNAAVASRTRSGFLQAWAYHMQGKTDEANEEIKKMVCIHSVFPSQVDSAHMEMVGRGLETHLAIEERMTLLDMYVEYGKKCERIAREALSLAY